MLRNIRIPYETLDEMKQIREAWGHSLAAIVRKSVNRMQRHGVVIDSFRTITTEANSEAVQVTMPAEMAKIEHADVVAAVRWNMEQHREVRENWTAPELSI